MMRSLSPGLLSAIVVAAIVAYYMYRNINTTRQETMYFNAHGHRHVPQDGELLELCAVAEAQGLTPKLERCAHIPGPMEAPTCGPWTPDTHPMLTQPATHIATPYHTRHRLETLCKTRREDNSIALESCPNRPYTFK
jgi:hypothetical protein